ncbi:hypothetical protein [Serratia plymuthica]|uniref:hypothetical protein n=1 Tax=Serratia plymuthica TaxID=82996 RepID=UPI0007EB53E0|nr:hypothetical protein [Serratia plymuthica]ANJ92433.1 hypothetical protein ADP72_05315 [Serratia plymuthica]
MADSDLKKDVQISSTHLDALMLPANFSRAYQLYVIQQGSDMGKLAGRANAAGQGAAEAQEANAEQDKLIASQGEAIEGIRGDYVSKTETANQSITSQLSAASFAVNGVKVIGARVNGFTPATGAAHKGMFDADKSFDTDTTPDGLKETRQRLKAIEDALRSHGLID